MHGLIGLIGLTGLTDLIGLIDLIVHIHAAKILKRGRARTVPVVNSFTQDDWRLEHGEG